MTDKGNDGITCCGKLRDERYCASCGRKLESSTQEENRPAYPEGKFSEFVASLGTRARGRLARAGIKSFVHLCEHTEADLLNASAEKTLKPSHRSNWGFGEGSLEDLKMNLLRYGLSMKAD